jgi:hypothetical protein
MTRFLSSGRVQHGAFDDDPSGHKFPECNQQLSRERDDRRLLETAAIALDLFFEPPGERRVWLARIQSHASWISVLRSRGLADFVAREERRSGGDWALI